MLMAPQLSTHISASKVLVNQVLDTPVKSIAPLVATPMTAEMAKHYTAHQIPEQFLKNTSATPNELAENMSEQFLIDWELIEQFLMNTVPFIIGTLHEFIIP